MSVQPAILFLFVTVTWCYPPATLDTIPHGNNSSTFTDDSFSTERSFQAVHNQMVYPAIAARLVRLLATH